MCGFDVIRRGNYFRGYPIRTAEIEVRVGKLKNGKATGKDEITGEMIRSVGPEDWRSAVIVPLYKCKGERTDCKNYRGISL